MFVSGRIRRSLKPPDKRKDRDSNLQRIISLLSGERELEGSEEREEGLFSSFPVIHESVFINNQYTTKTKEVHLVLCHYFEDIFIIAFKSVHQ